MGFFRTLFGGPDGTRASVRESYEAHKRQSPAADPRSRHERGLYGALDSRYRATQEPRPAIQIWTELIPFLLMDEAEGVEALGEIMVMEEAPLEAKNVWLGERIRWAIRERLPDASDFLRSGAARALRQGHRPWLAFLTQAERDVILSSAPDQP